MPLRHINIKQSDIKTNQGIPFFFFDNVFVKNSQVFHTNLLNNLFNKQFKDLN